MVIAQPFFFFFLNFKIRPIYIYYYYFILVHPNEAISLPFKALVTSLSAQQNGTIFT